MKVAAGAALVLPDGRWVLQRRTDDAPTDPDMLSFFGGGLEGDEKPEQALLRELAEETSIVLTEERYPQISKPIVLKHGGQTLKVYIYSINIPAMDFKVFEGKWAETYSLSELRERNDTTDVVRAILQELLEK